KGRQLSFVGAQLLHYAGAVDNFGMRQVSGKLVEVERTEGTVAFTQGDVSGVFVAKRLFEAAKNAAPISRPGFVDYGGPRFAGVFLSVVAGIVADDNHASDQGMGLKILHGFKNRFLVVIRGEYHCKAVERKIVFFRAARGSPLERKKDEEVKGNEESAESRRNTAVPKQELDGMDH